jgi:small GTP-binding protein
LIINNKNKRKNNIYKKKMSSNDIKIEEITDGNVKDDFKLKIVVVGDSGVGKTNLIRRFIQDDFQSNSKATVGVEFFSKSFKMNDNVFKIEIWDTAGQERYKSITAAYYKGAKGGLVVYDVTSKTSFDNVDNWVSEIKEKASTDMKTMMIGNKIDLKDERAVSTEEALEKAKLLELPLMEASALDSTNVKQAFYDLLKEMYKEVKKTIDVVEQAEKQNEGVQLDTNQSDEKKGCC